MPTNPFAERDAIVAELARLLKTATEDELAYIAKADYGYDTEKHYAALRDVIFNRAGIMNDGQVYFPSEVIEIIAYSREDRVGRSFEISTAILMINEMLESTNAARTIGYMQFRWESIGAGFFEIDGDFRKAVLLGFHWLKYQHDGWFDTKSPTPVPTREEIYVL